MAKKNDTVLLLFALLLTLVPLGGVAYWGVRPLQSPATDQPKTFAEFAASHEIPFGTWQYGGSTAWAAIRKVVDQKIQADIPNFKLVYTQDPVLAPSSGTGIKMLTEGRLSVAQSSRPLGEAEYGDAARRGFQIKQIPVAYDAIVAVVHPNLALKGLTIEQLVGIYTGTVTNWLEIGGPDLTITPYRGEVTGGAEVMLKAFFPKGADFGTNFQITKTPSEAIQKIGNAASAAEQGGIYIASARTLIGQCSVKPLPIGRSSNELVAPYAGELVPAEQCPNQRNQIDRAAISSSRYPLTRRLFVVVREDSSIDTAVGKTYAELLLTAEGQQLIEEAGFTRMR
jgi:phosphate transport system substrate-binding protein